MTGASQGIGLAIAESFEREGAYVVRLARTLKPARTARRTDIPCDVTRDADIDRVAASLRADGRVPDILVNNAGSFLLKPLVDTTPSEFRDLIAVNLIGPFLVLRAFLPMMLRRGTGHIVSIGSVADHVALPGNAAYSASKYGLRGLHEVLARELEGTSLHATLVSPGATDTSLWDTIDRIANPGLPERTSMRKPEDVAASVMKEVLGPRSAVPAGEKRQA